MSANKVFRLPEVANIILERSHALIGDLNSSKKIKGNEICPKAKTEYEADHTLFNLDRMRANMFQ